MSPASSIPHPRHWHDGRREAEGLAEVGRLHALGTSDPLVAIFVKFVQRYPTTFLVLSTIVMGSIVIASIVIIVSVVS